MEALQPHIKCKKGDVAETVFLVGDPQRIPLVTKYWDEKKMVADHRGLPVWTGMYKGIPVSVANTAMGCPSASIVIEELANIGVKTFIRIGTCGGLKKEIKPGDLIIPTAAIRAEGTTKEYIEPEFPAIADMGLVMALEKSAQALKAKYWKGINRTHDAFYERLDNLSKWGKTHKDIRMKNWNIPIVSSEMECSVVFLLPLLMGLRGAAILSVNTTEPFELIEKDPELIYELIEEPKTDDGIDKAIRVALNSLTYI
jgi:uridine phosphorylase